VEEGVQGPVRYRRPKCEREVGATVFNFGVQSQGI
jgi:hypothetical protein